MNFKILLYEWLQTAEAKREDALELAFAKVKKEPKNKYLVYDFFTEVIRHNEFKEMQAVLYDLLK